MAEEHEEVAGEPASVFILGEGGGIFEMSLPLHETIADKLAKGYLRRVQPDGEPYVEGDRPDGVPTLPESRPALNALKGEWVGWAVVQGLTPDEAEALTKTDLIERFGAGQEPVVPESTPDGQEPPADPPADPATGGGQPPAE